MIETMLLGILIVAGLYLLTSGVTDIAYHRVKKLRKNDRLRREKREMEEAKFFEAERKSITSP